MPSSLKSHYCRHAPKRKVQFPVWSKIFIHIYKVSLQMFEEEDKDENSWRTDGFGPNGADLIISFNLAHSYFSSVRIFAVAFLNILHAVLKLLYSVVSSVTLFQLSKTIATLWFLSFILLSALKRCRFAVSLSSSMWSRCLLLSQQHVHKQHTGVQRHAELCLPLGWEPV